MMQRFPALRRTTADTLRKAAQALFPVSRFYQQFLGFISEPFAGAWQRNLGSMNTPQNVLGFSAVYACVSLIAGDISKLRIKLMQDDNDNGISTEVRGFDSPFLPVLKKPNDYQTRIQFMMSWIVSKLLYGNFYALKGREPSRRLVTDLYPLDPCTVTPLVAENGAVYYRLYRDYLAEVGDDNVIVPASEIIHDRMITPWHPLLGVSPIFACGMAAIQGLSIESNSTKFFENMSRPSGILTAPGKIANETAERLKNSWEANYQGGNLGKLAVLGDGLEYQPMTIPPADAQLIEQLRMSVEQIARCFHVPGYKIGLPASMTLGNSAQYDSDYYTQCLQALIEACELLFDEGLELPAKYHTEFDIDGLLRMDPQAQAETNKIRISAGELSPNEARAGRGLAPVKGGESPYLQQQNYSLEALAKRDASEDPFAKTPALPAPASEPAPAKAIAAEVVAALPQPAVSFPTAKQIAEELRAALPKVETEEDSAALFAKALIKKFSEAARAL